MGGAEKILWAFGLVVGAIAVLTPLITPQDDRPPLWAATFGQLLDGVSGTLQGAAITLTFALFLFRVFLSHNPAESAARASTAKGGRALLEEMTILLADSPSPARRRELLRWVETEDDVRAMSVLNAEAFRTSPNYSADVEAKLRRNGPLLKRAPHCFAFVRYRDQDIGFSSIVPLTADFHELYVAGRLSDHDLKPAMMPGPRQPASCLVLFAIALHPSLEQERGGIRHLIYMRTLLHAHAIHLRDMIDQYGDDATPLVVQAEKGSIIRALESAGFAEGKTKGGDGDRLLVTSLARLVAANQPSTPTVSSGISA